MIPNKDLEDKDYVTFEAAKALKEVGFDMPTHTHYHINNGKTVISISSKPETWIDYANVIDRPILQKALEWLREKHHVSLRVNWSDASRDWFYDYLDISDGSYMDSDEYYVDYYDAVNSGICEMCAYIRSDNEI